MQHGQRLCARSPTFTEMLQFYRNATVYSPARARLHTPGQKSKKIPKVHRLHGAKAASLGSSGQQETLNRQPNGSVLAPHLEAEALQLPCNYRCNYSRKVRIFAESWGGGHPGCCYNNLRPTLYIIYHICTIIH